MRDKYMFPLSELAKGLMGYTIIIALLLLIFPNQELAIKLANGITPLFFLTLGGLLIDSIDWLRIRNTNLKT